MAESSAKPRYWQDPEWRTWKPPLAAGIGVGIGAALAEWFELDRMEGYALMGALLFVGWFGFALWLLAKRSG